MDKNQIQSVVIDVTTKKKYVKPYFEVIELNMEAPLLSASGNATGVNAQATQGVQLFGGSWD